MNFADAPIDPKSTERLAARGLRLGLVDTSDVDAFSAWLQADSRGFYGGRIAQKHIDEQVRDAAYRRTSGVWDETAADPLTPVATVASWPTELTVPGGQTVPGWAISSVTVSPTHRRRGIARGLLEAELRTAHSLGVPVAILTVTEATIYTRYGFAPAVMAADLTFDTRRAGWAGPAASGRLHFITLDELREQGRPLLERARLRAPGEVVLDDSLWNHLIGVAGDDKDESKLLRAVRYDDADGAPQGFALYRVAGKDSGHSADATAHTATVEYLAAATDDAYAGLWRYLLELDLVSTLKAPLRSVDEPVLWQVADLRGVRESQHTDHLWTRILNVKAALEARRYSAPGQFAFEISDPLGFGEGSVLVSIDADGAASVSPAERIAGTPGLALSVNDLSALYLGGVSAVSLVRAGRITELAPGSADAVDAAFRAGVAPWLSIWF